MVHPSDKIIVPLDVDDLEMAIALINKLPEVNFWKVGLELFVATGADILEVLKDKGKRIFLDLKFHDIPNTVKGATNSALKYDVDLLTIHATAGRKALTAAKQVVAERNKPKLIAITLLTSINSRELAIDLKIPLELPEYALQMAVLAQESGLDGAVCSPKEVSQLRQVCGENFLLICPGVRPSWSNLEDQKRVMTPQEALKKGADLLVIGRPITQAENPQEAWEKIGQEVINI
jgi:orotidine-5'-phosphate decarboxylase